MAAAKKNLEMHLSQSHNPSAAACMALYRLHEIAVIAQALHDMVQQQAIFSLYAQPVVAPEAAREGVVAEQDAVLGLARIASLDTQQHSMVWQLPKATGILPAQLWAIAQLPGGVRVQCSVQGVWQPQDGDHVLHMPWPSEILQLQRRRHQRFPVPLGQNYTASFLLGQRRCVLDVDDISAAGLALRGRRTETAMLFMGRSLSQVQLHLAEYGSIPVNLQVRSRRSYRSFLLGEQVLVGCTMELQGEEAQHSLQALLAGGKPLPQA